VRPSLPTAGLASTIELLWPQEVREGQGKGGRAREEEENGARLLLWEPFRLAMGWPTGSASPHYDGKLGGVEFFVV